jgi:glycosyltransferase involved in cell wall biosynthesis
VTRDERRLIFVGTLVRRKGLDVLLEALEVDDLRDVPLDVVGEGPERASLEVRARTLDVSFHGDAEPERVRELYQRAATMVVPSRADPWGVVLNEGMAAGCVPVASTAAGATADLVDDGVTGFAVPPDDPGALRSALRTLLADREKRAQMGEAARTRSQANSPEACARGLLESVEVGLAG